MGKILDLLIENGIKENIAMLYENEARKLLKEATADKSGSFETVVFPIVRRVFSKMPANDFGECASQRFTNEKPNDNEND